MTCRLAFAALAACVVASTAAARSTLDRRVSWSEQKQTAAGAVVYRTSRIRVDGERWRIDFTIENRTRKTIYPLPWSFHVPANRTFGGTPIDKWWGPSLAWLGENVVGRRQLILAHASFQTAKPRPIGAGKRFSAAFGGRGPLPAHTDIYVVFQYFELGSPFQEYDPVSGFPRLEDANSFYWITDHTFRI